MNKIIKTSQTKKIILRCAVIEMLNDLIVDMLQKGRESTCETVLLLEACLFKQRLELSRDLKRLMNIITVSAEK